MRRRAHYDSGGATHHDGEGHRLSALFFLSAGTLAACLLLGGGAANVYLSNPILQVAALPCLVAALRRLYERGAPRAAQHALYLLAFVLFLVILQLIPLPPGVWSALPLREKAVSAFAALGLPTPWAPLSLTPEATLVGALTMIPPAAIFLSVVSLDFTERRLLTLVALAFGLVNAFLGLMQLSQGPESHLFFYRYGANQDAIGVFANRNHLAALLYGLTPFAAAWIGALAPAVSTRSRRRRRLRINTRELVALLAAAVTAFALIVATLMARSRAGVILLMVALLSGLALQPWRALAREGSRARGVYVVVTVLALMLGLQYGLYRILMRFDVDPLSDARVQISRITADAAWRAWPYGTGLGSFAPLYASLQAPADLIPDRFVNLAHNDALQFALEAGLPGAVLLLGLVAWLLMRRREVWRDDAWISSQQEGGAIDFLLPRAAMFSVALLLAHSLVDYPLRTTALMSFFALCCGLLVPPRQSAPPAPVDFTRADGHIDAPLG